MNAKVLCCAVAAAAGLAAPVLAAPVATITLPPAGDPGALTSNGQEGSAANRVVTVTTSGPGTVARLDLSGTLVSAGIGSYPSEARILVTTPSGATVTIQPFRRNDTFTEVTATAFATALPEVELATGTWTFRFFESFDDGGEEAVDASWANGLVIVLDDTPPPPPPTPATFVDLGELQPGTPISAVGSIPSAGEVAWFRLTVPAAFATQAGSYLALDTEGSPVTDTMIGVFVENAIGELRTVDNDDGSNNLSQISYGAATCGGGGRFFALSWDGRDGQIPVGTVWLAVSPFLSSFSNGYEVVNDSPAVGDVVLNVSSGTAPAPAAPSTLVDLGTIPETGEFVVGRTTLDPNGVSWFRFTTTRAADAALNTYVDLDTETSVLTGGDTQVAVFDSSGQLVREGDDGGTALLSVLAFGGGVRCPTQTPDSAGGLYIGEGVLPAGTYFVAVTEFPTNFANGWLACPTTTAVGGEAALRVRAGTQVVQTSPPSSAINLGTLQPTGAFASTSVTLEQGEVRWFRFTLAEAVGPGCSDNLNYLDIDTEGTDPGVDTVLVVYNPSGEGFQAVDFDSGSGLNAALSWGAGLRPGEGDGFVYDGRNGELAAGEYYFAVAQGTRWRFAPNYLACPDAFEPTANAVVRVRLGTVPPAAPPVSAVDLGTLSTERTLPLTVSGTIESAGEVRWYRFATAAATDIEQRFLDIDTEGSTGLVDTTVALYNAAGGLIAVDDESGSGLLGRLSFGGDTAPRPAVGDGFPYDGSNGQLEAGTYFLVVAGSPLAVGFCDWAVVGGSGSIGAYTVNFNTGLPALPSGGCSIADVTGIGGPPATADGLLTGDDFNAFIGAFAGGDLLADVTGIGGPPATPDGLLTGDDFNAFIAAFAAGCP